MKRKPLTETERVAVREKFESLLESRDYFFVKTDSTIHRLKHLLPGFHVIKEAGRPNIAQRFSQRLFVFCRYDKITQFFYLHIFTSELSYYLELRGFPNQDLLEKMFTLSELNKHYPIRCCKTDSFKPVAEYFSTTNCLRTHERESLNL